MDHNLYLYPKAISGNTETTVKDFLKLLLLDFEGITLYKNRNIYNNPIIYEIIQNNSQETGFIIDSLETMNSSDDFVSIEEMNLNFGLCNNGFLGLIFVNATFEKNTIVYDNNSLEAFKTTDLLNLITFRNFWDIKDICFPHLIFSDVVEGQIRRNGDSREFAQIIEQLKLLNSFTKNWKSGIFSYKELNKETSLTCTPESKLTIDNYSTERTFGLPCGERVVFDLHLKTGNLRFHFYPLNDSHKVVIGYIGPHLRTWTN